MELRAGLDAALGGHFVDPLLLALADSIHRYRIPPCYLQAVIDGVEMDLSPRTYESFADLAKYCQRVASVVGQACIHIWGFSGERALELADRCGLAFQLTNILRDIREDMVRGRIYLPQADMQRFGYTAEDLRQGVLDDRFRSLLRFEIDRAEGFFHSAAELYNHLHADGRRIYGAMFRTYHRLLDKIRHANGDATEARVRLATWEKLRTAVEAILLPLDGFYRVQSSSAAVP
jgi:phytoene synthase